MTQKMFNLIPPGTQFNFVGKRKLWMGLSAVFIAISFVLLFTRGLNYGIEFTGGAEVHIKVPGAWDTAKLRAELSKADLAGLRIQRIGMPDQNEYLVRAQGDEKSISMISLKVSDTLKKSIPEDQFQVLRADVVGPAAGKVLRQKGVLAVVYALLVILAYVAIRFDTRYAPGAVLALFHDTLIVLGIFVIIQMPFDLTILAAILALIGYSNNDTIVVFDRVRETLHLNPQYSIEQAVNQSINETLGRSILTSLMTFITAAALYIFGGTVIEGFAFTFMVGIIVGTYSSIFIASSAIIAITHHRENKVIRFKQGGGVTKKRREYAVRPEPKLGG